MARKVGKKDSRYLARLVTENRAPCAFCHREADDEVTYGKLYAIGDLKCHYLCALLSCCLVQKGPEEVGLFGFMYKDIIAELERSKKHKCSFCGCGGANLGCSVSSCRKQFHLPCGRERNAVSLFYGSYKSFCQIHAPKQSVSEHIMCKAKLRMKDGKNKIALNGVPSSDNDMVCVICYEPVDAFPAVNTFWPPCCARDAWFHRTCLQRMALSAGIHYLKCPLCNDKEIFYDAVLSQGYYVPDRDAAWELEQNAFAEIYERPLTCTVEVCQCPLGRSHDADQGMWDIKLCLLCGSVGAHAQCIGASERTRYVCLTCTPAAPSDLQGLADSIDKLIIQEQQLSASNVRSGPVMPSRMSLRRTKGRVAHLNRPSSSRARDIKTECVSPAVSPNVQSSRQELNLKTPRKLAHNLLESPRKRTRTPNKQDEYKQSPVKQAQLNSCQANSAMEERLLSPLKLLKQSFKEKILRMGSNAILDDKVVDILRCRFNKPRPLSEKKKIIEDILDGLFEDLNRSYKQKEPVREWCSPRKCYDIPEDDETQSVASNNVPKASENTVENKENCMQVTPTKSKRINQSSTPKKAVMKNIECEDTTMNETDVKHNYINENIETVVNKESYDVDEKHQKIHENSKDTAMNKESYNDDEHQKISESIKYTAINNEKHDEINENSNEKKYDIIGKKQEIGNKDPSDQDKLHENEVNLRDTAMNEESDAMNKELDKCDEKHQGIKDHKEIDGLHDDSSNSTFQLPSEFVSETFSDDSHLTFQSPKRRTVEMKQDSSLEISEQGHSVNIDVIDLSDSSKKPDVKKCSFKFSRLDKGKLEETDVGLDLESFKKGYLNEVDKFKCSFNHNHDSSTKNKSSKNMNFRTVIDFAIDAHEELNVKRKRKLSEGLVLSYGENKSKKRKISENDLDLGFSSDDFETKKEFNCPVKKIESPVKNIELHDKNEETTREKKKAKYKRLKRERKTRYNMKHGERVKGIKSNDDSKKTNDEDKNLLDRKLDLKKRCNIDKHLNRETHKNRSNDENNYLKKEEISLLHRKKTKQNRAKQKIKLKQPKGEEKSTKNKVIDEICLNERKWDAEEKHVKQKIKLNNGSKQLKGEEKHTKDKVIGENCLKEIKSDAEKNIKQKITDRSHYKIRKQKDEKYVQDRKLDCKDHVKHKSRSNTEKKVTEGNVKAIDYEIDRLKDKQRPKPEKIAKVKSRCSGKHSTKHNTDLEKQVSMNNNQNIEVTIDSFKGKSKKKTKLSFRNNEKDISVKIKWKKKQFRLKIESKKKAEKFRKDDSKFKQYVLQYFSEVTPKEVLVKPEKEVSPLKRKYVKQEKTTDKFKQMSIQNFFKVKSSPEREE